MQHLNCLHSKMKLKVALFFLFFILLANCAPKKNNEGFEEKPTEPDAKKKAKEFVEKGEKIGYAIFSAAYNGNFDIVKYFIKKGASLDGSSYIVNAAAYSGNIELVKYFTNEKGIFDENGIKINNGMEIDDNAVPSAASNGKIAMIKYLVEERNMKIDDRCINNAAAGNHFDIIKYLLGDEVRDEQGNIYKLPKGTRPGNMSDNSVRNAKSEEIKDYLIKSRQEQEMAAFKNF